MPPLVSTAVHSPQPPRGTIRPLDHPMSKARQPNYALAASWAAPPTPQDSQASDSTPPSPASPHMLPPSTPLKPTPTDGSLSAGGKVMVPATAAAAALPTPEQTPPSPRCSRSGSHSISTPFGPRGLEARMQQWLTDIPPSMSPQERYLQGLDPKVDHPLHPLPLQVPAGRHRTRLGSVGEENRQPFQDIKAGEQDKENAQQKKLSSLGPDHIPSSPQENKKRHNSEHDLEALLARKRTRILDPVRRFSQKVSSSLALGPAMEEIATVQRYLNTMSSEDAAKQSELLYRHSHVDKPQRRASSFRASLAKRPGSLRASGSDALRRIMKKPPVTAPPSQAGAWTQGPDRIVNVAFIGDALVGKSALIRRLVHGTFPQAYVPSDIQESTLRLTVDEVRVQLNLSEAGSNHSAGQPSILALGWFSVVVLCFDIGHPSSLESLQKYRNDIAMYEENAVVILAGLKLDARHRLPPLHVSPADKDAMPVSAVEGEEAAARMRCNSYFECSSLDSCEGMDNLFDCIVRSGIDLQKSRDKKMARFRLEHSVDKSMAKIADGVRSLFLFHGNAASN